MNPHTQGEGRGSRQTGPGKKGINRTSAAVHANRHKQS